MDRFVGVEVRTPSYKIELDWNIIDLDLIGLLSRHFGLKTIISRL